MSLGRGLGQHIKKTASDAVVRITVYTDPARDLVGHSESYPLYIIRQTIRIFPQDLAYGTAVLLIQAHTQRHGDPVLLQHQHHISQIRLFLHLLSDLPGDPFTDALYLRKPFRLFLNDPKSILAKAAHDAGSQSLSHTFDGSGAEIPFYSHGILRHLFRIGGNLQLASIGRMIHKLALNLQHFPLVDHLKGADAGQLFPVTV